MILTKWQYGDRNWKYLCISKSVINVTSLQFQWQTWAFRPKLNVVEVVAVVDVMYYYYYYSASTATATTSVMFLCIMSEDSIVFLLHLLLCATISWWMKYGERSRRQRFQITTSDPEQKGDLIDRVTRFQYWFIHPCPRNFIMGAQNKFCAAQYTDYSTNSSEHLAYLPVCI